MDIDNYYPQTEPVELLPSFVLYADILGFKSIIKENSKAEDLQNLNYISSTLHRILLFEKEALDTISDVFEGKIKVFSDNYLFWIPIRDVTDGRPEIFTIVEEFARFQFSMACNGFHLRGGACVGYAFVNENMAIGPALLSAIEIEESIAKYPCIVFDPKILEPRIRYYIDNHWPGDERMIKYLLITPDGYWMINYLEYFWEIISRDIEQGMDFYDDHKSRQYLIQNSINRYKYWILDHKERIKDQLNNSELKPEVKAKFLWLADYHNFYFRKSLDGTVENIEEYIIPKEIGFSFRYYKEPSFYF